jgi:hypothetical protein
MTDHDNELDPAPVTTKVTPPPDIPLETQPGLGEDEVIVEEVDLDAGNEVLDISTKITESQELTRAKIAWTFTEVFLFIVVAALVLPTLVNISQPGMFSDPIETSKGLVTTIASVLAGPFGFIVGFYFKRNSGS